MKRRDAFPSKYLTAEDLPTEGVIVTIHHVEEEKMRDGSMKSVAYFEELVKGMVVNVTKWKVIEAISGEDDTDDWAGTRIRIYPSETTFEGDVVPCINVDKKRPKEPKVANGAVKAPAPKAAVADAKPIKRGAMTQTEADEGEDDREETDDRAPF